MCGDCDFRDWVQQMPEEVSYILSRKEHKCRFPGNTLPRPGLLLNPWVVGSTETDTQVADMGGVFEDLVGGAGSSKREARADGLRMRRGMRNASVPVADASVYTLDFLANPGVTLTNLPVRSVRCVFIGCRLIVRLSALLGLVWFD
jgi:hypothetical protein